MNDFSPLNVDSTVSFVGENVSFVSLLNPQTLVTATSSETKNTLRYYNLVTEYSEKHNQILDDSISQHCVGPVALPNRSTQHFPLSGNATKLVVDSKSELVLCSTSCGDLYFNCTQNAASDMMDYSCSEEVSVSHIWENVHGNKMSVNTFDQSLINVVSFGENNTICLFQVDHYGTVHRVNNNSGSSPFCCKFTSPNTILSGDLLGNIVNFDMREITTPHKFSTPRNSNSFAKVKNGGFHPNAITCMDVKPDQNDVFACGMENGEIFIWDLRNTSIPLSTFEGHQSSIWDVKFHPMNSSLLYSASETGEVWQWNAMENISQSYSSRGFTLAGETTNSSGGKDVVNNNIWNSSNNEISIDSLLPESNVFGVCSLSVLQSTLTCAVRNQSVFVLTGLNF